MKESMFSRRRWPLALFFAAVFLLVLLFSALTPMIADDYSYCFSWVDSRRVTSPLQIPASMAAHRVLTNGRVVAHGLVQLILLAPKALFDLLNACNAALLFLLFSRFLREREPRRLLLLLVCGALLLWNGMPAFGQVVFWLDGAVNYSWGISLFLLFLLPYASLYLNGPSKRRPLRDLAFLVLSLAAGAYSENGSLAALFAAFCLTLLSSLRERRFFWRPAAGLVLGAVGYGFLMSAPATAGRSAGMDLSLVAKNVKTILTLAREELLPLFLLFAAALALCLLLKADRRRLVLAAVLFLAGLGSLSCFFFATYFVPRHFCFTVYFTVLACLLLFSALLEKGRAQLPVLTAAVMAVLFVFNLALGGLDVAVIHQQFRRREAQIREALAAGEARVCLEIYQPSTRYSAAWGLEDLNLEETNIWPNWSLADYYGIDSVLGVLPDSAD